ncbi:MAG: ABC transporter permease, partial [Acidaminobacteraceae bacterium]
MADISKISKDMWQSVPKESKDTEQISRPSMTYWQDAWRRLKKNYLSMLGLATIALIVLAAVFGPMVTQHDYSTQDLTMSSVPPSFEIYKVDDETFVYIHREYRLIQVDENGALLGNIKLDENNMTERYRAYKLNGYEIVLDYKYAVMSDEENPEGIKYKLLADGKELSEYKTVRNNTYLLGSDTLGRDVLARVLFGARISLFIALISTVVNFFIGVTYGGLSGYLGGRVDNFMMRIVDIISVIPLLLYVILLSVLIGSGLKSIIIALGSVYWVGMARIVRGQVLSLKEQEYVLAART